MGSFKKRLREVTMNVYHILFIALIIDFIFGDPKKIWDKISHPAVIMGKLIHWLDETLNHGEYRRIKGFITISVLSFIAILCGRIIHYIPDFGIIKILCVTVLLAHNNLVKHVRAVGVTLGQSIEKGRAQVAKIVGRETKNLNQTQVITAAIESGAENFSDAVIAPIFWYLILSPFGWEFEGIILYKIINTADSMIGHKSEKFIEFGYGAAKFDDILNWIPARLCGGLMCLSSLSITAWELMLTSARLHASPNAGWPESAMAGILNIRMSGPRIYEGILTNDDYINPNGEHDLKTSSIDHAIKVLNRSWVCVTLIVGMIGLFTW